MQSQCSGSSIRSQWRGGKWSTKLQGLSQRHRGAEREHRLSKEEVAGTCQGAEALFVWFDVR